VAFEDGPQPELGERDGKTGAWRYRGDSRSSVVLTDVGVEIRHGLLGFAGEFRGPKLIPYGHISAIRLKKHLLGGGEIEFLLTSGPPENPAVNRINFSDRRRFEEARDIIQWRIDNLASGGSAPAPAARDVAAQLADLAKMHEAGTLTDEEFQAAKATLLEHYKQRRQGCS
jgi:hypothetical protein